MPQPDPMRLSRPRALQPVYDTSPTTVVTMLFLERALKMSALRVSDWETPVRDMPDIAGETFRLTLGRQPEILVERDGIVASIDLAGGGVSVRVAATLDGCAEAFIEEMRETFPASEHDAEAPEVPVTFWSYSPMGPRSRRRRISVPAWTAINANYAHATFEALCDLMDSFQPGAAGQLLLWHGPPGTGKTYALRALAWEWRKWCSLHYVTDPEQLFGEHASYLLDVLFDEDDDGPIAVSPRRASLDEPDVEPVDPRAEGGRWRLLVLEDTGELMTSDARQRSGHGLGRLLNVVDGMIGQGLKVLVLVTTNEEVGRLHPAIGRSGRCAAMTYFDALPREQAVAWLEGRGAILAADDVREDVCTSRITIADLYARGTGARPVPAAALGFMP